MNRWCETQQIIRRHTIEPIQWVHCTQSPMCTSVSNDTESPVDCNHWVGPLQQFTAAHQCIQWHTITPPLNLLCGPMHPFNLAHQCIQWHTNTTPLNPFISHWVYLPILPSAPVHPMTHNHHTIEPIQWVHCTQSPTCTSVSNDTE